MNARRTFARGCGPVLVTLFLSAILGVVPTALGQDDLPLLKARAQDDEQAVAEMFEQKMRLPTSLEFVDTPLTDVFDVLTSQSEIPFALDEKALTDAGVGSDTAVTFHVRDVRLESALRMMLKDMDLDWDYRNETVVITSRDQAAAWVSTRVYPIGDLLKRIGGEGETLLQTVRLVAPEVWFEQGGPAHASIYDGSLVVSASRSVQADVANLLGDVRRVYGLYAPPAAKRATEQAALDALDQTVEVEFVDTPLTDVFDVLSTRYDVQVRLDEKSLTDVGVGTDTAITKKVKGITLRSFLNLLLADLDLTFAIENEVLTVMSIADSESRLTLRLHACEGLANDGPRAQRLRALIESSVGAASWMSAGGAASMQVLPGLLVVRQTPQRQDLIATLLAKLRAGARAEAETVGQGPSESVPSGSSPSESFEDYRRVVYAVHDLSPSDVADAIRSSVAPHTWQAGYANILVVRALPASQGAAAAANTVAAETGTPGGEDLQANQDGAAAVVAGSASAASRLIIFQRPDVHAEIAKLLRELHAASADDDTVGPQRGGGGFFRD